MAEKPVGMESREEKKSREAKLVARCQKGESSAQLELYNTFSQKMFGVCMRYAKDYHAAEDLLQEGFVKVFKNIDKFRGDGSFEGWVRRIFINTSIEHYRKQVRMYPIQANEPSEFDHYHENTMDHLLEEDVLKLVQSLSPGYRTVFNLYVIEGYSHKEIAEQLNISEGTSKSQLARARYILQKKVAESNEINLSDSEENSDGKQPNAN